jgi:hypothetical protein
MFKKHPAEWFYLNNLAPSLIMARIIRNKSYSSYIGKACNNNFYAYFYYFAFVSIEMTRHIDSRVKRGSYTP